MAAASPQRTELRIKQGGGGNKSWTMQSNQLTSVAAAPQHNRR